MAAEVIKVKVLKAIAPLILWLLITAFFSFMPLDNDGPELLPHQDKIWHFLNYAVLAWLICKLISKELVTVPNVLLALLLSSLYGLLMELGQGILNTGRYFDYFDIIANIIGSFSGSLVYYFTRKN